MKRSLRVMQKCSKEGITVRNNRIRMSIVEIHIQQYQLHLGGKGASTIMKENTK
jgi:hypothetical protein